MQVEQIARICHEANRVVQSSVGEQTVEWSRAPAEMKSSTRAGVAYRLKHPEVCPKDQHDEWVLSKTGEGWVFGERKDEIAKTHPNLVVYSELPQQQKFKDHLFIAIVDACREIK